MKSLKRLPLYVVIGIIAVYALFPFYWAIITSFKSESEMFRRATMFPQQPTLRNYDFVFRNQSFMRALGNSTVVSLSSTLLALATVHLRRTLWADYSSGDALFSCTWFCL